MSATIPQNAPQASCLPVAPLLDSVTQDAGGTLMRDIVLLTKLRLSTLVMLSAVVGFFFGSTEQINWVLLVHTFLGTALVAAGSSALNQLLERKSDALMHRTADRPLPAGRITPTQALYFGVISSVAGMIYLATCTSFDAALISALTLAIYLFAYTPLKKITSMNTLVGAVPGALPPLIGYAAAHGTLGPQAWALFAIVFIWQLPHFLAIAWLYRKDYERGGYIMLPRVDDEGYSCGRQVVLQSITLIPISLVPLFFGMAGTNYAIGALVMGFAFLGFGLNFAVRRSDFAARQLFLASVTYLPLLLALMMVDAK
jgi:protoheme IX farnesyltransferase